MITNFKMAEMQEARDRHILDVLAGFVEAIEQSHLDLDWLFPKLGRITKDFELLVARVEKLEERMNSHGWRSDDTN
jgi:hypothetical protein